VVAEADVEGDAVIAVIVGVAEDEVEGGAEAVGDTDGDGYCGAHMSASAASRCSAAAVPTT